MFEDLTAKSDFTLEKRKEFVDLFASAVKKSYEQYGMTVEKTELEDMSMIQLLSGGKEHVVFVINFTIGAVEKMQLVAGSGINYKKIDSRTDFTDWEGFITKHRKTILHPNQSNAVLLKDKIPATNTAENVPQKATTEMMTREGGLGNTPDEDLYKEFYHRPNSLDWYQKRDFSVVWFVWRKKKTEFYKDFERAGHVGEEGLDYSSCLQ